MDKWHVSVGLKGSGLNRRRAAFSLVEVLVSLSIAMTTIAGIIYGYVQCSRRAEWSAYSLAAQSLALQRLEQTRAAKWDPQAYPPVDQLNATNFPVQVESLDLPIAGRNVVQATNYTTIRLLTSNPPLKMIRVDCVWSFDEERLFTNRIVTYRAPDQ